MLGLTFFSGRFRVNACSSVATVPNLVAIVYLSTLTFVQYSDLPLLATPHKPNIFIACYLHEGSLSLSVSYAMLMRPNKAETAVHGLGSLFFPVDRGNARSTVAISALFSGY